MLVNVVSAVTVVVLVSVVMVEAAVVVDNVDGYLSRIPCMLWAPFLQSASVLQ